MTRDDSPDVIGPPSPMPTAKEAWMAKYVLRMVSRGVEQDFALACYHGAEDSHDFDSDPEDAADDEMSYWDDGGATP